MNVLENISESCGPENVERQKEMNNTKMSGFSHIFEHLLFADTIRKPRIQK